MNDALMNKNSRLILSSLAILGIASIFGTIVYISTTNPDLITTQSDSEESTDDEDGETNDASNSATSNSEESALDDGGETNDTVESATSDSEITTGDNETSDDADSSTD